VSPLLLVGSGIRLLLVAVVVVVVILLLLLLVAVWRWFVSGWY
jgi:hypothetical protein